jgi:NitT/TauT family transport system substrate-binding protein
VRAGALLQGTINASIVDGAAWRLLQEEGGGKFKRLSIEGVNATDEALYAGADFLNEREDDVVVLVQELMRTWKEIAENPDVAAELREQYDLLADLPAEVETDVAMFYREAVEGGVFPVDPSRPKTCRTISRSWPRRAACRRSRQPGPGGFLGLRPGAACA